MLKVPISGICRPSPLVMPSWCHPGPGWPAPGPAPAVLRRKYAGASSGPDNCLPPQDVPTGRCEEAGVRQELPWLAGDEHPCRTTRIAPHYWAELAGPVTATAG